MANKISAVRLAVTIGNDAIDAKDFLIYLLEGNPAIVIDAYEAYIGGNAKSRAIAEAQAHVTQFRAHYPRVWSWLAAGEKVNAIKALREVTGMGLKEAKDECDKALQLAYDAGILK